MPPPRYSRPATSNGLAPSRSYFAMGVVAPKRTADTSAAASPGDEPLRAPRSFALMQACYGINFRNVRVIATPAPLASVPPTRPRAANQAGPRLRDLRRGLHRRLCSARRWIRRDSASGHIAWREDGALRSCARSAFWQCAPRRRRNRPSGSSVRGPDGGPWIAKPRNLLATRTVVAMWAGIQRRTSRSLDSLTSPLDDWTRIRRVQPIPRSTRPHVAVRRAV